MSREAVVLFVPQDRSPLLWELREAVQDVLSEEARVVWSTQEGNAFLYTRLDAWDVALLATLLRPDGRFAEVGAWWGFPVRKDLA